MRFVSMILMCFLILAAVPALAQDYAAQKVTMNWQGQSFSRPKFGQPLFLCAEFTKDFSDGQLNSVRFELNGTPVSEFTFDSGAGYWVWCPGTILQMPLGTNTLVARLDPDNLVAETNESNNTAAITFTVEGTEVPVAWKRSAVLNSCEGPSGWPTPGFDDDTWFDVTLPYSHDLPTSNDTFFRGRFNWDGSQALRISWNSDDGSTITLNGQFVAAGGSGCHQGGCVGQSLGCGGDGGGADLTPFAVPGENILGMHLTAPPGFARIQAQVAAAPMTMPNPFIMDGVLDGTPCNFDGFYVEEQDGWIYVATDRAIGNDAFIYLSADPSTPVAVNWGKAGTVGRWTYFLGAEGSNAYARWFDAGAAELSDSSDDFVSRRSGAFLEGAIRRELISAGGSVKAALGVYGSANGGALTFQSPGAVVANGNIEGSEFLDVLSGGALCTPTPTPTPSPTPTPIPSPTPTVTPAPTLAVPCWYIPRAADILSQPSSYGAEPWKFTTATPAADWTLPVFDDSGWETGAMGFGRLGSPPLPSDNIRTDWQTNQIWMRKQVTVTAEQAARGVRFFGRFEDPIVIWINGTRVHEAVQATGNSYAPIYPDVIALDALQVGSNTIAIQGFSNRASTFIDVAVVVDDGAYFNDAEFHPTTFLLPPGNRGDEAWLYTFADPGSSWAEEAFDDSSWTSGLMGLGSGPFNLGNGILPVARLRTNWSASASVWLRKEATVPAQALGKFGFWITHDDSIEIYVNGILAYSSTTSRFNPTLARPTDAGQAAFRAGTNTIAIKATDVGCCGRYIDFGLTELPVVNPPISGGQTDVRLEAFSDIIVRLMKEHQASAASLAISQRGRVLVNRSFGWKDNKASVPLQPNALFAMQAVDQWVIYGGIEKLLAQAPSLPETGATLTRNTRVFPYFAARGLTPLPGFTPDSRINDVTVAHLLGNTAGLANSAGFVEHFSYAGSCGAMNADIPIRYFMSQTMQFTPGTTGIESHDYENKVVLQYLLQAVTGDSEAFYRNSVFSASLPGEMFRTRDRWTERPASRPFMLHQDFPPLPSWAFRDDMGEYTASARSLVRYSRAYNHEDGSSLLNPISGIYQPNRSGWNWRWLWNRSGVVLMHQDYDNQIDLAIQFNRGFGELGDAFIDEIRPLIENTQANNHPTLPDLRNLTTDTNPPLHVVDSTRTPAQQSGPLATGYVIVSDILIGLEVPRETRLFHRTPSTAWQEAIGAVDEATGAFSFPATNNQLNHVTFVSSDLAQNTNPIPSGLSGTGIYTITVGTPATPSPSPSATPTASQSPSPSASPSFSPSPTFVPTRSLSPTASPSPTAPPTASPIPTPVPPGQPPSPPGSLRAIPGADSILLLWEASAEADVLGYQVYRRLSADAFSPLGGIRFETAYLDETTSAGLRYDYYVTALREGNPAIESAPSQTAFATAGIVPVLLTGGRAPASGVGVVRVGLENANVEFESVEIELDFSTAVLNPPSPLRVQNTGLTADFQFAAIVTAPGRLKVIGSSQVGLIRGEGSLFAIPFPVLGTAANGAQGAVSVRSFRLLRAGVEIPVILPPPVAIEAAGSFVRGDVDGNGLVQTADAALAQQIIVGSLLPTSLGLEAGDLNRERQSRIVDAVDATFILRLLAGLPIYDPAALAKAQDFAETRSFVDFSKAECGEGEIKVPLVINGARAVANLEATVVWDPAVLDFLGLEDSSNLRSQGYLIEAKATAGRARVSFAGARRLNAGVAEIGALRFKILKRDSPVLTIGLADSRAGGEFGERPSPQTYTSRGARLVACSAADFLLFPSSSARSEDPNRDGALDAADLREAIVGTGSFPR